MYEVAFLFEQDWGTKKKESELWGWELKNVKVEFYFALRVRGIKISLKNYFGVIFFQVGWSFF